MAADNQRRAAQPTPQREPFNAADPTAIAERTKESKVRDDIRVAGLVEMMNTKEGRAFVRHLLVDKLFTGVGSHVPPDSFTGNSTTFYNAGQKRVGEMLRAELFKFCKTAFRLMEDEGEFSA